MGITIVLEATRLKCNECEFLYTDDDPGEARAKLDPAFECECGNVFGKDDTDNGNNQCPDCHKFAPKSDPDEYAICEECNEAATFEEVYVITCACHSEEHEVYV
jgi:hypothetical protein